MIWASVLVWLFPPTGDLVCATILTLLTGDFGEGGVLTGLCAGCGTGAGLCTGCGLGAGLGLLLGTLSNRIRLSGEGVEAAAAPVALPELLLLRLLPPSDKNCEGLCSISANLDVGFGEPPDSL